MKISHVILFAGVFILGVEIIIFQLNLHGYSDSVDSELINEKSLEKITTLYIVIAMIFFVFGGIINFLEKRREEKFRKLSNSE